MKKIALIGSTGSIGKQVLNVVRKHPHDFKIVALATNARTDEFASQVLEFKPEFYAIASEDKKAAYRAAQWESADLVVNAAAGFAGLEYSLKAIKAGKTLALANKETLVCGGELVTDFAEQNGVDIIPVDSEHSAIWQCLHFDKKQPFKRIILTASGGALRGYSKKQLETVTPEEVLNHPVWKMGNKITVDSATLMNKGYEVIEAHMLFGTPYPKIETVIHPQGIVHSMVEFMDGSILAQMGQPNMEIPIQLALSYPDRLPTALPPLDFKHGLTYEYEGVFRKDYPLYALAVRCGKEGGILPCALNAADEVAVKAFLDGVISFLDIYEVVEGVMATTSRDDMVNFKQLAEVDREARLKAKKIISKLHK